MLQLQEIQAEGKMQKIVKTTANMNCCKLTPQTEMLQTPSWSRSPNRIDQTLSKDRMLRFNRMVRKKEERKVVL